MGEKIKALDIALKKMHRRFLENERLEAERQLDKKITPVDFFNLLLGDERFSWINPLNTLISEVDLVTDDAEKMTSEEVAKVQSLVKTVLFEKNEKISSRYQYYVDHDSEFSQLHADLQKSLKKES
jgi:hypothetical protein